MRFFSKEEVYEPLDTNALYESSFEKIVSEALKYLLPHVHVLPFKKTIYNDFESAIPDLMFIDRDYREWWIVEVELADHSLEGHVLPQVRVFSTGKYDRSTVEYILSKNNALDRGRLELMVKGEQPRIVVISNRDSEIWRGRLKDYGVIFMSLEVFESQRGNRSSLLKGSLPSLGEKVLSKVAFVPTVKAIKIGSPAALHALLRAEDERGEYIPIFFNDLVSFWKPLEIKTELWLIPQNNNPLNKTRKYQLVQHESGGFAFEEEPKGSP